jgi:hypothetical protein
MWQLEHHGWESGIIETKASTAFSYSEAESGLLGI